MEILGKKIFSMLVALIFFTQVSSVAAAEPIEEVRLIIEHYYVDPVPAETLQQPSIKAITDQLDPYSVYMTKKEFENFSNTLNQELVGIGIVLEEHEQGIKVIQTIPGAPAEKAGIQAGAIITHANGQSLKGKSTQFAVSIISGAENTSVTITFLQNGQTYTKTIIRKRISLPNVETEMLAGNIGYIRLHSFSENATKEIQQAIKSLSNANGYIFDLRDNGGGYVSTAQDVIGLFPKTSLAFQLKQRSQDIEVFRSLNQNIQFEKPVHLLINGNSASASEMVAAAVKEQYAATLYGQRTYGKGSMQGLFLLSDQSVLKLTTGRFYSPNGKTIDGVGVTPHFKTEVGKEIEVAHFDFLKKGLKNYKVLPTLENVPTTKKFTIKMNMNMDETSITKEAIQLIQLGGQEVETDVTILNEREIQVTPKTELQSRGEYLLIIHPNWTSQAGTKMNQGTYLTVTVE